METMNKHISYQWAHANFKVQFHFQICWICKSSVYDSHRDNDKGPRNGSTTNYSTSILRYYSMLILTSCWTHYCIAWMTEMCMM